MIEPVSSAQHRAFFRAVEESRGALLPWLPWVPLNDSEEASLRYTQACERDWDKGAALRFFLRLRDEPEVVGVVSLENCVQTHRSCELGYWLHPTHHGQGLMTEAAAQVVKFAFARLKMHRIRAAAAVENVASQRVIGRLGFEKEGSARDAEYVNGRWVTHWVYARLETDPVDDVSCP
jgi:ribosomal-protein-serine acetyltransferase